MIYEKDFENLIDNSIKYNQYVGLGNPIGKMLFIGKEASIPINAESYHGSGQSWKTNDYSIRYKPKENNLRNYNHTWQKYQKLYDYIFEKLSLETTEKEKYEITFVENVFATELSNLHAPKTSDAKKQKEFKTELENRKEIFWKTNFINQFPIVVIFASDNKYIETYSGELCELFNVEFKEMRICSKSDKLWIHYSKDKLHKVFPKIVIHTRQLTNGASNELIEEIGNLIADFVMENSLKIKIK